ncbi:MAG TPA: SUMF1/EgtB/PvdO family nonheme iron enzyme [Candidatus Hydrogenedentes bacterium]|nr:SUMF1/EgtB/PvdO family nonheme iron enzyme [Candidatus Hydrogenedentota bacterium]
MSARYSLSVLLCLAMFAGCAAVSPAPASAEEAWWAAPQHRAAALRRAVEDLAAAFPAQYAKAPEFLQRLDALDKRIAAAQGDDLKAAADELTALQREALLANPLLDFDRLLLVRRAEGSMGLPQNWQGNCSLPRAGFDNEIAVLSPVNPDGALTTLYKPEKDVMVADVDLHFDGGKMLFSMIGSHNRWQIWEINADGSGLRQVTSGEYPDVDNYDPCYLPNGQIVFGSTGVFHGVPCVGGSDTVANLFRMDADGGNMRQLSFDQDHNWCPTMLANGRVLYSRWEYSDTPHYFSRILFSMNPDGTNQAEYYGSNSYWPNSIFYARPIPGHPTQVVAIVTGHHGVARMGELVLFDPAQGRKEGNGVIQRIPGFGQPVEPVIVDQLVDNSWPKFLHPYPLSGKYFLVSCKPSPETPWGLYLADIYDNLVLIKELPGQALLEPVPLRGVERPPVVPDRVKPDTDKATVYIADIYRGEGLRGVPRGVVKSLRVFEIYYGYPKMGGHINIGIEGPWDVHRILGTVPVLEDGSCYFKIPANIPVALQPLDAQGRAVQLMRSWFVGMPGEAVSCIGCHEKQNETPPAAPTLAVQQAPMDITPWNGPARGFSFKRDVQPVLDRHCVGCHDDAAVEKNPAKPNLAANDKRGWSGFTPSYIALHPYVRRPGPESDYHVLPPMDFGANTSQLIQMLEKGHHGVKVPPEDMERLYTWIDLNVPDHGTWSEHTKIPENFHQRRLEMRTKYAGRPEDPEVIPELDLGSREFQAPPKEKPAKQKAVKAKGWPFDAKDAAARQAEAGAEARRTVDLGDGVALELALVPAGRFVMGAPEGFPDETPQAEAAVDAPFYMGVTEVTNAQYARFDPSHNSGFIDQQHKDHTTPGYPAQAPENPVIRVPWSRALEFCAWLSEQTGMECTLPTEAEWEWACRAGSAKPFWYGDLDTDFAPFANLADHSIRLLAVSGVNPQPIPKPSRFEDFLPKDPRFNDGQRIVSPVRLYQPNPWGLHDMHGNVAEWTLSLYKPYPYAADDGRNDPAAEGRRVARGGSWFDRPKRAQAGSRLAYEPWQPVYDVGFRVLVRPPRDAKLAANH